MRKDGEPFIGYARPYVAAVLKELIAARTTASYKDVVDIASRDYGLEGGSAHQVGGIAGWMNDDVATLRVGSPFPFRAHLL